MTPHPYVSELGHCGNDVDGIAAKPIQLRDNQNVARLEAIQQLAKARALLNGGAARHSFRYDAARTHFEPGRFNLSDLVLWSSATTAFSAGAPNDSV
jgi:hypothetical protein